MTQRSEEATARAGAPRGAALPDDALAASCGVAKRDVHVRFSRSAKRHAVGVEELLHEGRARALIATRWKGKGA